MNRPTKGAIEDAVAAAVTRFQREQHGRGSIEVRAFLVGDMLLVRSRGIFTQTEDRLSATEEGRRLIKSARLELRSINHTDIEAVIAQIVGCPVLRSYCDLNVEAAEQVEAYVLEIDVERKLLRADLDHLGGLGRGSGTSR